MGKLTDKKNNKLPIEPLKIPGEVNVVPISDLKPGYEKLIDFSEAVVGYFDVLGFSAKKDPEDIRLTLLDFSAPLALAAEQFLTVRINVFSDCAFVVAPLENARDLLSAIRFAFQQWIADGILVRGGLTIGQYSETLSHVIREAKSNFRGNLFAGCGVNNAVALEHTGNGALLFTDEKCAKFYNKKYGEPIFKLMDSSIIGWSDDKNTLCNFLGISLWHLVTIFSKKAASNPTTEKLINKSTIRLMQLQTLYRIL